MNNLVYLYQYQLQKFINAAESFQLGVAYEWKGENVYHAYLEYPQIAPSGYAVPCLFLKVDNTADFDRTETVVNRMKEIHPVVTNGGKVIVFWVRDGR